MHKTRKQGIKLFKKYRGKNGNGEQYYDEHISFASGTTKSKNGKCNMTNKKNAARSRFKIKYKQGKLLDNNFMKKKPETRGRKKKYDIDEVISNLTDKEKDEMLRRYLEISNKDKKEANNYNGSPTRKGYIFGLCRTTFYKKQIKRKYKFDIYKDEVTKIFDKSKSRYGSERIRQALLKQGISISGRTLRNYMNRGGLKCITRQAKRIGEKKYKLYVPDIVNRDYHGENNSIKATDVSYISANESQNFVYLSATIDHKTKYVHGSMSKVNDLELVMETQKQITDTDYILHSDHGGQYFQPELLEFNQKRNIKTSMKATDDPLDNREIEYFFGSIKSECLYHLQTNKMKFEEIKNIVSEYINGYNKERIQKRLQGKTPAEASAHAI